MDITPVIRSCQSIGLTQITMLQYEMLVLKKLDYDLTGSHLTLLLHLSPPVIILTLYHTNPYTILHIAHTPASFLSFFCAIGLFNETEYSRYTLPSEVIILTELLRLSSLFILNPIYKTYKASDIAGCLVYKLRRHFMCKPVWRHDLTEMTSCDPTAGQNKQLLRMMDKSPVLLKIPLLKTTRRYAHTLTLDTCTSAATTQDSISSNNSIYTSSNALYDGDDEEGEKDEEMIIYNTQSCSQEDTINLSLAGNIDLAHLKFRQSPICVADDDLLDLVDAATASFLSSTNQHSSSINKKSPMNPLLGNMYQPGTQSAFKQPTSTTSYTSSNENSSCGEAAAGRPINKRLSFDQAATASATAKRTRLN